MVEPKGVYSVLINYNIICTKNLNFKLRDLNGSDDEFIDVQQTKERSALSTDG